MSRKKPAVLERKKPFRMLLLPSRSPSLGLTPSLSNWLSLCGYQVIQERAESFLAVATEVAWLQPSSFLLTRINYCTTHTFVSALHTPPKNGYFEGRTYNWLCVCFLELLLVGRIMLRSEGTEVKLSSDESICLWTWTYLLVSLCPWTNVLPSLSPLNSPPREWRYLTSIELREDLLQRTRVKYSV